MRFSEFEGKWSKKTLRDITSLITKGTTPKKFVESGVNYVKIECLKGHVIDKGKCLFIDNETHEKELKRSQLKENDIIFAIAGATIGKCSIVSSEILPANTNQALSIIRLNNNENKDYIFQILTSERMSKYILDNISVGAQPNLNLEQINSFSFFYPTLPEQTKIATFLSAVDEKLNLLKEKKTALEEYKKGIMQKIFSQEIRFKDDNGNDFAEWVKVVLKDVFDYKKGSGLSKDKLDIKGKYSCILYGELYTKYNEVIFNVISKTNSNEGLKSIKGDLLIPSSTTTSGIDLANVTALNFDNVLLGGDITVLRSNQNVSSVFYAYYLSNHKKEEIASYAQGITIVHLYYNHIKDMIIDLPCIEEQTKIANFLSAIDEKIELVRTQIEDTQEYKKGLLQGMFC